MGYGQQRGGGWSGDLSIAVADQHSNAQQPRHVYHRRVPHAQVSVVLNRATAPHYVFFVLTETVSQPPSRFGETRLNTY